MIITDNARDELRKMLEEQNASSIRIFFDGYG
jgi:Fe-S cluster assembly iron-binding protein IscA